ncbi:MAG: hypothetical protein AAGE05_06540 [Pseudomonadota bacterium]
MEMPIVLALTGLACVAGFLGLFLYFGHRSGRGDLIAPPTRPRRQKAARPAPKPLPRSEPAISEPDRPVADRIAVIAGPPSEPTSAPARDPSADPAAIWRREGPAGRARLSEACYTAEQYAEREVKALLLQNRPDRAVRHARNRLKLPAAEAEAYVDRLARGLRV